MLVVLLLVLAFVCFLIGAFAPALGWTGRPGWVSLGLALWVLTSLLSAWPHS